MLRYFSALAPSRLILCCLAFSCSLLVPATGRAQLKTAAEARIRQLNKMAMDEYDGLEFDKAKEQLLEALKLASTAQVDEKVLLANTHINLGVVFGAGFGDQASALKSFLAALRLNRAALIAPARATPALQKLLEQARAQLGPAVPEEPAFRHKLVERSRRGVPIPLKALVKASLGAAKVVCFFRKSGAAQFQRNAMSLVDEAYVGVIPASAATGRSIYYYIEAQDQAGGRLAGSGEAASPNIVTLASAGGDEDGTPGPTTRATLPESAPVVDDTDVSLAIVVGSGGGLVFGGETDHLQPSVSGGADHVIGVEPGGAWAPLHVGAEFSYHISSRWQIGLLGRVQLLNGVTGGRSVEEMSYLGLLRVKRFFEPLGRVRFYLSAGGGVGQVRFRLPINQQKDTPAGIVDSYAAGPGVIHMGGGLQVRLARSFALVCEVVGMVLVPDFAANADLNMGFVLSL